jgi:hypothetical protein
MLQQKKYFCACLTSLSTRGQDNNFYFFAPAGQNYVFRIKIKNFPSAKNQNQFGKLTRILKTATPVLLRMEQFPKVPARFWKLIFKILFKIQK